MKKSVSILTAIIVVLTMIYTCALPVFASAKSKSVAMIIKRFECFVDDVTAQMFFDQSGAEAQIVLPVIDDAIDEITESIAETQEEDLQEVEEIVEEIEEDEQEMCTKYTYGYSEMGQPLEAFIINGYGASNKVFFMDFAVHGFEDEYENDGKVLVDLGYKLVDYYSEHPEALGDYKMVIVPCANPDGVMYGVNDHRVDEDNAFGRCTYAGVDMNRDFRDDLFYATESRALKSLMDEYKPSVYLNFHGWENSVLGDPDLIGILVPGLDLSRGNPDWYRAGDGFIMGYVKEHYGAKSALVEFRNSYSVNADQVIDALNEVMCCDL